MLAPCNKKFGEVQHCSEAHQAFPVVVFFYSTILSMRLLSSCFLPRSCKRAAAHPRITSVPRLGDKGMGKQEGWIYVRKAKASAETLSRATLWDPMAPPAARQSSEAYSFNLAQWIKLGSFRKKEGMNIGVSR